MKNGIMKNIDEKGRDDMAIQPKTQILPPAGEYHTFLNEVHYKEKVKEWGLPAKKEFWYKDRNYQELVSIKGYESYGVTGEYYTLVIEFPDGTISCIHPAYLKEMQQSGFEKESLLLAPSEVQQRESVKTAPKKAISKTKGEKTPKIQLPADKVHFTASVKQFALTYNPFNEENDEVIVLENVQIVQDSPIELGLAWCSHSKTLKKLELAPGDSLEFDGKVITKKLAKGKDVSEEFTIETPVLYKINNPSKIIKIG